LPCRCDNSGMAQHSDPDQTLVRMPSLRAIKSFVAAAKHQSFTRAAEALCVTQAAISRQIRELEDHLGTELFIRTGRSVKRSADGVVFYDTAQLSFINICWPVWSVPGAEVTRGLTRMEMGLGLRAGLSIVAIALLLDRLSRAAFRGKRKAATR
jgi:Bacterial regulatory helix-turn-helix protein, lysR family